MLFADRARRVLPLFLLCLAGACLLAGVLAFSPPGAQADPGPGTPNKPWPSSCDVDVGLVIDRSNSVKQDEPNNPTLVRNAAGGLVDRLTGTGARVAVWSFGTMASGYAGPNPWNPALRLGPADYPSVGFTELPDAAAGDRLHQVIDRIPFVTGAAFDPDDPDTNQAGATNWEAGLGRDSRVGAGAVAPDGSSPGDADVLIFFTDGNPTLSGSATQPDSPTPNSSDTDVDDGIAAADQVKAGDTRIVAVGASLGGGLSVPNLERVTGGHPAAAEGEDYFITTIEGLDQTLFEITTRFCGGNLVVRKMVPGTEPGSWRPEPGWRFETTFPNGTPSFLQPAAGGHETGADGTITYRWINAAGGTPVRVAETLAPGQALHHSYCAAAGQEAEHLNATELEVTVPQNGYVVCELYNYRPAVAIEVEKTATPITVPAGGGEVTYAIAVRNPSTVDRVRLEGLEDDRFGDLFDPGDTITSTTCEELAGEVLEPGGSVTCEVVAEVSADEGDHVNVVTATGTEVRPDGTDGTEVTASDDATVTALPAPDVAVVKDDGRSEVAPGEQLTYELEVTNHGTAAAPEVAITDQLPENVTFVSASDEGTLAGRTVTWPAVALDVGQTVTRSVTVRVDSAAVDGDQVHNVATVHAEGDPNPDDDTDVDDDVVVLEPEVRPASTSRTSARSSGGAGSLPRTGSEPRGWALIGLGLASLGASALLALRLRPPATLPARP
jgi:uncharacterized repeat protein (TIGR01451 family)